MYIGDNRDLFPPNPDDANTVRGHNWCPGNAGVGGPQEFDPDVLRDPDRSLLISYLSGNVAVFRCPADRRQGLYQGTAPSLVGQQVPAARSFSMSQAVGTICPGYDSGNGHSGIHTGVPTMPVNGPWLNNQFDHRRNSPWLTYGKMSAIAAPGPSSLWVILDEDVNGLNDAAFAFGMEAAQWWDAPGTYHNGGCGFAFADGHSETHQWASKSEKGHGGAIASSPQDKQDWLWMRARTSAAAPGTLPPPVP
jgi:prepilin-type processing-associated H-X9-DG protein